MKLLIRLYERIIPYKPPCFFRLFTGLYCPGCGGSRAVYALLRGHIFQSMLYHPLVVYSLIIIIALVGRAIIFKIRGNGQGKAPVPGWTLFLALGLVICNFIIKNLVLIIWGIRLI